MKPFSLVSLSILSLIFLITFHATDSQNLTESSCKAFSRDDPNIDFNFCTTSLKAIPASSNATLQGLGIISIQLIRYNITGTLYYIQQLVVNETWDPYTRQCLNDCFELFSNAIPSVQLAIRSYYATRYDDANIQISSVMDAATTCEDGFKEKRDVISPLTKRNNDTFQLSALALSVMHMIQTGSG